MRPERRITEEPDDLFPVLDVSSWRAQDYEAMGTKPKRWFEDDEGRAWLFKYLRQDTKGQRYGDDWAEKIAFELARSFGIPAPRVELAQSDREQGRVARGNLTPGLPQIRT